MDFLLVSSCFKFNKFQPKIAGNKDFYDECLVVIQNSKRFLKKNFFKIQKTNQNEQKYDLSIGILKRINQMKTSDVFNKFGGSSLSFFKPKEARLLLKLFRGEGCRVLDSEILDKYYSSDSCCLPVSCLLWHFEDKNKILKAIKDDVDQGIFVFEKNGIKYKYNSDFKNFVEQGFVDKKTLNDKRLVQKIEIDYFIFENFFIKNDFFIKFVGKKSANFNPPIFLVFLNGCFYDIYLIEFGVDF